MKNIVCFGANSDIAKELLRLLAEFETSNFYLFSRDTDRLGIFSKDLENIGAKSVEIFHFDALDPSPSLTTILNLDRIDYLILAHGYLPSKRLFNTDELDKVFRINCLSVINIIEALISKFIHQKGGKIVAVSSVAADRGRKKLGYYAAAKAGLDSYLSALRQELSKFTDIQVLTVKPGFIRTKMTENLTGPFPTTPDKVALDIFNGMMRNKQVIYTPSYWRVIMSIIKMIPENIFKKMSF